MRVVGVIRYAFGMSDLLTRECPVCGALVLDDKKHSEWHDTLLASNDNITCT